MPTTPVNNPVSPPNKVAKKVPHLKKPINAPIKAQITIAQARLGGKNPKTKPFVNIGPL